MQRLIIKTLLSLVTSISLSFMVISQDATETPVADQNLPKFKVAETNISVGAQPTIDGIIKIKDAGFTTVINLRSKDEDNNFDEEKLAAELGLKYINVPITTATDLNDKNISIIDAALKAAGGKAFIHCATGNRAAAILALRAYKMQDLPVEETLKLARELGFEGNDEVLRKRLSIK